MVTSSAPSTAYCTIPTQRSTSDHSLPSRYPAVTNRPFQMRLPSVVSSRYQCSRSRSTPAGSDPAQRTSGTIRPSNTAARPRPANHASAASTSEIRTIGSRTTSARARSLPRRAPTAYTVSEPATEPSVVQNSASARVHTPRLAE